MKGELVSSLPIQELRDNMLNPAYSLQFQQYLKNECGCCCTVMDDHSVLVHFPVGTIEEEYAQSTTWKRETIICLPNGVRLTRWVYPPMMEGGKALVALILPPGALEKRAGKESIQRNEKSRG